MCAQDRGADLIERRASLGGDAAFEPLMPLSPLADVLGVGLVEVLEQTDQGVLTGFHGSRSETHRHCERPAR